MQLICPVKILVEVDRYTPICHNRADFLDTIWNTKILCLFNQGQKCWYEFDYNKNIIKNLNKFENRSTFVNY